MTGLPADIREHYRELARRQKVDAPLHMRSLVIVMRMELRVRTTAGSVHERASTGRAGFRGDRGGAEGARPPCASDVMRCPQADSGGVGPVTDSHSTCWASWRELVIPETGNREEAAMHPMFKELFIQTDVDDLLTEGDRRPARRAARWPRTSL